MNRRDDHDAADWPPLPKRFPRPGEREPREFSTAEMRAACEWLRDVLRQGPMLAQSVLKAADACEVPRALVTLAKKKLGVVTTDANASLPGETFRAWVWALPPVRGGDLFDNDSTD